MIRIGHQYTAAARGLGRVLTIIAARRVVRDDGNRCEEALGLGIPGRLFKRKTEARRNDCRIDRDPDDHERVACGSVAVRREQRRKRRVLGVVCGDQQQTVAGNRHLINAGCSTGRDRLLDGRRSRRIEIDHLERTVAIAGVEPPAVRYHAVWPGVIVVHSRTGFVELDAHEAGDGPFELEMLGVDDVDACIRAIGQVIFRSVWIHPADVETGQSARRVLCGAGDPNRCARKSWCDPAGESPAQVRSSVRLVASVAWSPATVAAKRTQRLHRVWD